MTFRVACLILLAPLAWAQVPKIWDDRAMAGLELLLVKPEFAPKQMNAEAYYKIPVVEIYKSYPVYAPGHEPEGYMAFLQGQEPLIEWDPAKLPTTAAEWVRAGEALFDAPTRIGRIAYGQVELDPYIHNREWFEKVKPVIGSDGAVPGLHYVIRRKGKVEVGVNACSMCHSRVMPDGTVMMGGPGQFTFDAAVAEDIRKSGRSAEMIEKNRQLLRQWYFTPWAPHPEIFEKLAGFDHQQMALILDGRAGGVMSIDRAAPWAPVKVPDLIGVADRKYLGATGLAQQRSSEDLMRYIATHQDARETRLSDEQIYALTQFVTSLKPPKNPFKPNSFTKKGKAVFEREGCSGCHSGTYYTNNKLMAAPGFKVPDAHVKLYEIQEGNIGTDSGLALETMRATGYYRVPALNGLWYRGPFSHNGAVPELDQWMSGDRFRKDYFQSGFGGLGGQQGPVKGHEYGLHLSDQDMVALLGYLRTL